MDTIKKKIDSLKVMMKSFGISPGDVMDNNELLELLKTKMINGEISEQKVLGIINDLPKSRPASAPSAQTKSSTLRMLRFATHGASGLRYALHGSSVIGPVIEARGLKFVLDLKNCACNLTFEEAKEVAEQKETVNGISWIIPGDEHFYAILGFGTAKVNNFLEAFGGDKITNTPFLSATSQANRPSKWNVRLILPLP